MGEFGDKFRRAREKKELSFDDVSNVTKISTRMLQAIEEEHFDQLPGGVFNKGFIRAYAKHLGLDPENAVTDYLACLQQAQVDSHAGWDPEQRRDRRAPVITKEGVAPPPKAAPKVQAPVEAEELPGLQLPRAEHVRGAKKEYLFRPSSPKPWRLVAVAALIVIAALFFWSRRSRSVNTAAANSSAAAPTNQVSPQTTGGAAFPSKTPAQPQSNSSPSTPPIVSSVSSAAAAPKPQPVQPAPPAPATRAAAPAPEAVSTNTDQVKVERKDDVTIRSFGAAAAKPTEPSPASLTLVVRASETSWISVTADGQLVTQETLIAPAATRFHATRELVVRVGNAAGISFLWNGEELPPQGAEAEAKTLIFDGQGMRASASSQPAAQP